jgi:ankyrin repeat protein
VVALDEKTVLVIRCECDRQLLRKVSSIHSQSDSGDTPAHLAAYRGHLEPLRLLVLAGADLMLTNRRLHNVYEEAKDDHTLAYLHHLVLNERFGWYDLDIDIEA